MLIRDDISVSQFGNQKWVIHTMDNRNILINNATATLVEILTRAANYEEATINFNQAFRITLDPESFKKIVFDKIGGYDILKEDSVQRRESLKQQYLKLKVELLNPAVASMLSRPFRFFFRPGNFWMSFFCVLVFLVFVLTTHPVDGISVNYYLFLGLVYSSLMMHELGHIGACAAYGLKHGGIGFGFYVLMPVFYADITNIWQAIKEKRLIANMAGVFNEILYASILALIYLVTNNATFLMASLAISSMVVWQLNPFVRFDGYWMLSDLTGTPNLLMKAQHELKNFFTVKNLGGEKKEFRRKHNYFLLLYGMLNTLIVVGFMGYALFSVRSELLLFPQIIYDLIMKTMIFELSIEDFNRKLIVLMLFYFLFFRFLFQGIRKIYRRKHSSVSL
jgi:putative peptide zinc metalloprotease protein